MPFSSLQQLAPDKLCQLKTGSLVVFVQVNHAGDSPWWLPHAEWDGIHLADFVMPGFLVIVGVSIALSVSAQRQRGARAQDLVQKAAIRTSKLFFMGLFIQVSRALTRENQQISLTSSAWSSECIAGRCENWPLPRV